LDFIIKKLRITGWSPYLNGDLSADYHFAVVLSCSNLPCVYKLNFTCFAALKMSKKRQDTWQLCELCGRLFYCRHLSDHRAICEGNSTAECLQHAYIQDGVLHAVVFERNSKMLSGKARNIDLNGDLFSAESFSLVDDSTFFEIKSTRSCRNIQSSRRGGWHGVWRVSG